MRAFDRNKLARAVFAVLAFFCMLGAADARDIKSEMTNLDQMLRIRPKFPIPSEPNQLFYIERSSNSNTVIYVANLDAKGRFNPDKPIDAYWRWYNRGGYLKPLNFAERMMAYGIKDVKPDGKSGGYTFHTAAFPERSIHVDLDSQGHSEAFLKAGNGQWMKLVYVYLEVDDSGVLPDVTAIDFFGYDKITGKPVREHVTRQ